MYQTVFELEEGVEPFIMVKTMIPRGMKEGAYEISRNEFVKYCMDRPKLLKPLTELQEKVLSYKFTFPYSSPEPLPVAISLPFRFLILISDICNCLFPV